MSRRGRKAGAPREGAVCFGSLAGSWSQDSIRPAPAVPPLPGRRCSWGQGDARRAAAAASCSVVAPAKCFLFQESHKPRGCLPLRRGALELAVQPGTNVSSGAAFVMCVEDARAELRVGPAAVERAVRARESRPESGSGLKERGPSRGARGPRGLGHWQMGENWAVIRMPFLFFPLCSCDCSATARQPTLRSP